MQVGRDCVEVAKDLFQAVVDFGLDAFWKRGIEFAGSGGRLEGWVKRGAGEWTCRCSEKMTFLESAVTSREVLITRSRRSWFWSSSSRKDWNMLRKGLCGSFSAEVAEPTLL